MCNLGNFLQLNVGQELPLFAFVYMCLDAGYYYYYYYYYCYYLSPGSYSAYLFSIDYLPKVAVAHFSSSF
jgi:hypothetical protein